MAQINKPDDYFDISTWTATTSAISNLGFSPDWVWIKSTDSANGHILFDTIRGANERLSSANNAAESTRTDELMSFDSNGYTLGSSGNTNDTNPFNASYVGWSWRGSDSSAVSNTDGSITSTVSANTTSGFSIVSYTGTGANATVGHGLSVAPAFVIIKDRGNAISWVVSGDNIGWNKNMYLDDTSAIQTANHFQDTAPTSSLMYLSTDAAVNGSSRNYIMYCFAEKKGFSKFGSYTGNGNSDGPFIYTGFKPALFIVKKSSASGTNWKIFDNKRATTFNPTQTPFNANDNSAEDDNSAYALDFLSNGIKLRNTNGNMQNSGATHIYMAFAENPLVGTNNIPATAR